MARPPFVMFFLFANSQIGIASSFFEEWGIFKAAGSFSQSESSTFYEICPISVVRGQFWNQKHISALCNKAGLPPNLLYLLHNITWQSVNFIVSARHAPGHFSTLVDALSHLQFHIFHWFSLSAISWNWVLPISVLESYFFQSLFRSLSSTF